MKEAGKLVELIGGRFLKRSQSNAPNLLLLVTSFDKHHFWSPKYGGGAGEGKEHPLGP